MLMQLWLCFMVLFLVRATGGCGSTPHSPPICREPPDAVSSPSLSSTSVCSGKSTGAVRGPTSHHLSPTLKQVTALVCCLDPASDGMGQRRLCQLRLKRRRFSNPVSEAASKPMNGEVRPVYAIQNFGKGGIGQSFARASSGEHKRVVPLRQRANLLQDLHSWFRKGNSMFFFCLHPLPRGGDKYGQFRQQRRAEQVPLG